MKYLVPCLVAVFIFASRAVAGDAQWTVDYEKALTKAKEQNKHVLLDFTGSDWCYFCKELQKHVFTKNEFKEFAGKKLILVELDFPSRKEQPEEIKKRNRKLASQYKIEGYPTIVLLNSEGKEVFRKVGYAGTKAEDYIAELRKNLKES